MNKPFSFLLALAATNCVPAAIAQINDWQYLGNEGKSNTHLYIGKSAFRDPRQPNQVFYKLLLTNPAPIPQQKLSILFELTGSCTPVSIRLLNVAQYGADGMLIAQPGVAAIPAKDKNNLENTTPRSDGFNLLKKACALSAK